MDEIELKRVREQIELMLIKQYDLNTLFIGKAVGNNPDRILEVEAYKEGGWCAVASRHDLVDYRDTILDEAVELLRSDTTWKFWKKGAVVDHRNAKLEYIDILHFAMSEEMANCYDSVVDSSLYVKGKTDVRREVIERATLMMNQYVQTAFPVSLSQNAVRLALKNFLVHALGHRGIDWRGFWELGAAMSFPFDAVFGIYTAKSTLNEFRIEKGDGAGLYQRNWAFGFKDERTLIVDIQEDNFYLLEWYFSELDCTRTPNRNQIYRWLEDTYSKITNPITAKTA